MATTEGCLVASVNRGCSALRQCGVATVVEDVGMTREVSFLEGPHFVRVPSTNFLRLSRQTQV